MCDFFSCILGKDGRVYWDPMLDAHEDIIEKHGLKEADDTKRWVRIEATPQDYDLFNHDPGNWLVKVDQLSMPEWYERQTKHYEGIIRSLLVDEVFKKIFAINKIDEPIVIKEGRLFAKNSKIEARGSSTVEARGSSTVEAWDSSTVEARGSSTVEAWDSSTVEARGSSTVKAWDSSTVEARGSSTVEARGSSTVEAWDSSTVEARGSSTVIRPENSSNDKTPTLNDNAVYVDHVNHVIIAGKKRVCWTK